MKTWPPLRLLLLLVLIVVALCALSMVAGRVWIPLSAWTSFGEDPRWPIIAELRLPRTILGVLVGAALGGAGAALQGYTRNPLADPSVLGISTSASFGAVLTLYFGMAAASPIALPIAGILGALAGVVVLMSLAGVTTSLVTFILAGVVVQTVSSAGTALALNLAPTPWAVNEIVNWLMGSLADRSMDEVKLATPFIVVGLAIIYTTRRALDGLTLGEMGAQSLGFDLRRVRALIALGVALAVGASVAVSGVIGFVGLMAPHLMRPFAGARPGALLIPSALGGAILVLAADILVRLTPSAAEVKLGVAMGALGGPFFLMLLISLRRRLS